MALVCGCRTLYDMSVKLPSAGTKDTTRSAANLLSRTLGWKLYSSIKWLLLRLMLMSGMPLRRLLTSMVPWMALDNTRPSVSSVASMDSITSRYISLLAYLMLLERQGRGSSLRGSWSDTNTPWCPNTVDDTRLSRLGGGTSTLSPPGCVLTGIPLSSISSSSWYSVTWCSCSTLSVTSLKYALSTVCSCVRNSTTISGSVSVSVVAMYVISPRVM
mmetsp:Transcript_14638/g.35358  ORF Transcript_14638/g.35358 Transcript_14638/m.35358 type:complete len:216 (-) Transcript_14638:451-1098(-)